MRLIVSFIALLLAMGSSGALAQYNTTGGYGSGRVDPTTGAAYENSEGLKPTYSYVINDYTPTTIATAMLSLCGSATKTVRVLYVFVMGDATASAIYDVYLYKRTTLNTGGTATAPVSVVHDSNDAVATATLSLYSANPSALGAGALVRAGHLLLTNTTIPINFLSQQWQFGKQLDKAVVLRGVSQCLEFSGNGNAVPGGTSLYLIVSWSEE